MLRGILGLIILGSLICAAEHVFATPSYVYSLHFEDPVGAILDGIITTDTNSGPITISDITAWSFRGSGNGPPFRLNESSPLASERCLPTATGTCFLATPAALIFDSQSARFEGVPPGTGGVVVEFDRFDNSPEGCFNLLLWFWDAPPPANGTEMHNVRLPCGPVVVGLAVPEPVTLALIIPALVAAISVRRRRMLERSVRALPL
jgi:hypothetical protein